MNKYRKKPVVIEAAQIDTLDYDGLIKIIRWSGARVVGDVDLALGPVLAIDTLEGTMNADEADWIIKGVQGEFYPCKPEIFDATYEPVED